MAPTLEDYLAEHTTPEIGAAVLSLSLAVCNTATHLSILDDDAALEALAAAAVEDCLTRSHIRHLATPKGGIAVVGEDGGLAVAVDPLAAPTARSGALPGALFSVYPAAPGAPEASFLRPGDDQLAAGCCLFGPYTRLALTLGHGAALFTHDRGSGGFHLDTAKLRIPAGTAEFAANAAEYRRWEPPVQRFIDDCVSGAEGPSEQDFDMRWTGSLAAEAQRIMMHGGVYLAPRGTAQPPLLVHHCHPTAMLIEQAGGQATDGVSRILDRTANALGDTSPLVFGAPTKVARVAAYHDLPDSEISPLFSHRGLFRN